MYKGKHLSTAPAPKGKLRRPVAIISAVVLAVAIAAGATVAYLTAKTGSIQNVFSPSQVSCTVVDNGNEYTITNTSDVEAYIRVAVVCNWVDNDDNVHWQQPSYTVQAGEGWDTDTTDGFLYYTSPVAIGASTSAIKVTPTAANGNYTFAVQVLAEAIQSEPTDAVTSAWLVSVAGDGVTIGK